MTPALFAAGMVVLCAALCVGAVRAWRAVEARPLRPLEAWVARLAVAAVMALPLLADAGALPGPRASSVGLPLTGGTMTGQVVFSGVSTDISTASGESLTIAPAGAGGIGLQTTTGDVDIDTTTGNVTLDCTTANGEGCLRITHAETNGNGIWIEGSAGNNIRMRSSGATGGSALAFVKHTNTYGGIIGYSNTGASSDFADKLYAYTDGVEFRQTEVSNVAAGTLLFTINDTCSGTGCVRQFGVDGNGAAKFRVMTSTNGATCNSTNEGLLYYRVIDASNKSGFCMCARTASGAYGWKMGMTFGSSALTDGDC